jgi:hypothetical protein
METPKLSPAKINPTKLLPGTSISEKKISTQKLQEESISVLKSDLFIIKKQVFKIRDLIQTSTLIKQSELEKKRKSTEKKGAEEQENKLEAKPEKKEGKLKMPSAPKLGFLDRIKNFLFSVLLGYISIKLLPHLPKLVGIVSIIGNVMEFMIDLGGNILDKVVTFIDWGYKAIDATRGFMKSFGGDFSLKIFDTFTGAVSGVIDAAIIAAIALSTQGMGVEVVLVVEDQELEVREQEELIPELLENMQKDLVEMLHLKNLEKKDLVNWVENTQGLEQQTLQGKDWLVLLVKVEQKQFLDLQDLS